MEKVEDEVARAFDEAQIKSAEQDRIIALLEREAEDLEVSAQALRRVINRLAR